MNDAGVLKLDPFVVEEKRLPLRESDVLTAKGRLELARKLFPGLGLGNDKVALGMLDEQYAIMRRHEISELDDLLHTAGDKPPPAIKKSMDQARTRNNEWSSQEYTRFREPR